MIHNGYMKNYSKGNVQVFAVTVALLVAGTVNLCIYWGDLGWPLGPALPSVLQNPFYIMPLSAGALLKQKWSRWGLLATAIIAAMVAIAGLIKHGLDTLLLMDLCVGTFAGIILAVGPGVRYYFANPADKKVLPDYD